jgi:hypothetical protein
MTPVNPILAGTERELARCRSLMPSRELAARYAAEDLTAAEATGIPKDIKFARQMVAMHRRALRAARRYIAVLERHSDALNGLTKPAPVKVAA